MSAKRKVAYQLVLNVEVRKVSYALDEKGYAVRVKSEESPFKEAPYDEFGMVFHVPAKTPEEAVSVLSEAIREQMNRKGGL